MNKKLRDEIAKRLAFENDGMENSWHDYIDDADASIEIIKERIQPLLLGKTDVNLRLSLGDLLGLKITSAPTQNDPSRAIRSQVPTGVPFRRRTIRRRSSASDRFYENGVSSGSVSFSTQGQFRRLPNRPNIDPFSKL